MIAILSPVVDLNGAYIFNETSNSKLVDRSRRASRKQTLDGGASFVNLGYTDVDRDLFVEVPYDDDGFAVVTRLMGQNSGRAVISFFDGVFETILQNITQNEDTFTFTALITAKLSE